MSGKTFLDFKRQENNGDEVRLERWCQEDRMWLEANYISSYLT